MNRPLLWIFCIGVALFASFMSAIGLVIAGYDVPHAVLVWTLVLGIIGTVAGSPALAKRRSAARGFEVVPPNERRPGNEGGDTEN